MSFLKKLFRVDDPSTSEEYGHTTFRVLRTPPKTANPPPLTEEEQKQLAHRIFIFGRKKAYLERPQNPSLLDASRHQRTKETLRIAQLEADQTHAAWTYRFDFFQWNRAYNITEVALWDIANWVDDDNGEMALISSQAEVRPFNPADEMTPPNSDPVKRAKEEQARAQQAHNTNALWFNRKPLEQFQELNDETFQILKEQSGGRLERLVANLQRIDFETLILSDHTTYINRHTMFVFYLLKLLGNKVRNLQLDNMMAEKPIWLDDCLDIGELDSLLVTQPEEHRAFTDESVAYCLLKWLSIPVAKKRKISFFFRNVHHFPIRKFIETWMESKETHHFGKIVFDQGTIEVTKMMEILEQRWKCYTHPTIHDLAFRPLNAYMIPTRKKEIIFPHRYGEAIIHFCYKEGQYVFRFFPTVGIMLRHVLPERTWRHFIRAGCDLEWDAPGFHKDMIVFQVRRD